MIVLMNQLTSLLTYLLTFDVQCVGCTACTKSGVALILQSTIDSTVMYAGSHSLLAAWL